MKTKWLPSLAHPMISNEHILYALVYGIYQTIKLKAFHYNILNIWLVAMNLSKIINPHALCNFHTH